MTETFYEQSILWNIPKKQNKTHTQNKTKIHKNVK